MDAKASNGRPRRPLPAIPRWGIQSVGGYPSKEPVYTTTIKGKECSAGDCPKG
jgi:hypothetical protein